MVSMQACTATCCKRTTCITSKSFTPEAVWYWSSQLHYLHWLKGQGEPAPSSATPTVPWLTLRYIIVMT